MIIVTQQAFVGPIEVTESIEFETIEEYIIYLKYISESD